MEESHPNLKVFHIRDKHWVVNDWIHSQRIIVADGAIMTRDLQ